MPKMYSLEYVDYDHHGCTAVSESVDALKREAERIEHGSRRKPREYKWCDPEPFDFEEVVAVLHHTRSMDTGHWEIVEARVL